MDLRLFQNINSTLPSPLTPSSSPGWLHCVPAMWDGIPIGGLQESSVLHRKHWNWLCHELDHGSYGWSRYVKSQTWRSYQPVWKVCKSSCLSCSQTSQLPWCCPAAALGREPRLQRVCPRSIWQPSSPWASAEIKLRKPSEQRLEITPGLLFTSLLNGQITHSKHSAVFHQRDVQLVDKARSVTCQHTKYFFKFK